MAESIGLIERAAAVLRKRDANESDPLPPPAEEVNVGHGGPELVLDRGRLASYGITMPSSARSRTVEEFRLVKRNLMTPIFTRQFECRSAIQPADHGHQRPARRR